MSLLLAASFAAAQFRPLAGAAAPVGVPVAPLASPSLGSLPEPFGLSALPALAAAELPPFAESSRFDRLSANGEAAPAASSWPEADRLFRGDPRWLGGDAAYSVDLGGGRTLWVFGDSFVDPAGGGDRSRSAFVRNTIAVQHGADPTTARMTFHWGRRGGLSEFFGAPEGEWLWPAHGARLGSKLLLFFMRVRANGAGVFGFEPFGWSAKLVENPDAAPEVWSVREIASGEGALAGSSGVWTEAGWLYAMSPSADASEMRLTRWPLERAAAGDLSSPLWWDGAGWTVSGKPAAVFRPAATEGSVTRTESGWSLTQTLPGGALGVRRAERPEGPWSEPEALFAPPEAARQDAFTYAAKAHPHLGNVATYAANAWEPARLFEDPDLYYPRFVRLP